MDFFTKLFSFFIIWGKPEDKSRKNKRGGFKNMMSSNLMPPGPPGPPGPR